MQDEHRNGLFEEVIEIFDRWGLGMMCVQQLNEVLSGGGISCEDVSWRRPEVLTFGRPVAGLICEPRIIRSYMVLVL
jgi:hypothetical protein